MNRHERRAERPLRSPRDKLEFARKITAELRGTGHYNKIAAMTRRSGVTLAEMRAHFADVDSLDSMTDEEFLQQVFAWVRARGGSITQSVDGSGCLRFHGVRFKGLEDDVVNRRTEEEIKARASVLADRVRELFGEHLDYENPEDECVRLEVAANIVSSIALDLENRSAPSFEHVICLFTDMLFHRCREVEKNSTRQ